MAKELSIGFRFGLHIGSHLLQLLICLHRILTVKSRKKYGLEGSASKGSAFSRFAPRRKLLLKTK